MFHHLRMPDGTYVHCFEHPKNMVDELRMPWDPPPVEPTNLLEVGQFTSRRRQFTDHGVK